ncbi:hypothetical protein [Turicimonas sp. TL08]
MSKFPTTKAVRSWVKEVNKKTICVKELTYFGYKAVYMSLAELCEVTVEYAGYGKIIFDGEDLDPISAREKLNYLYNEEFADRYRFTSKKDALAWANDYFNMNNEEEVEQKINLIEDIKAARKN